MQIYNLDDKTEDAMIFGKQNYPHYDVAVLNILNTIYVDLIHPDLVQ